MVCPSCCHSNQEGAAFCEECGAPLGRACAACGNENPPEAAFCAGCGRALATSVVKQPPAPAQASVEVHPEAAPSPGEEAGGCQRLVMELAALSALVFGWTPPALAAWVFDEWWDPKWWEPKWYTVWTAPWSIAAAVFAFATVRPPGGRLLGFLVFVAFFVVVGLVPLGVIFGYLGLLHHFVIGD